jgi:hypothetical protein
VGTKQCDETPHHLITYCESLSKNRESILGSRELPEFYFAWRPKQIHKFITTEDVSWMEEREDNPF